MSRPDVPLRQNLSREGKPAKQAAIARGPYSEDSLEILTFDARRIRSWNVSPFAITRYLLEQLTFDGSDAISWNSSPSWIGSPKRCGGQWIA
jgi:hypothetical protein